jgi:FtsZ-binding cell division protein ZapB
VHQDPEYPRTLRVLGLPVEREELTALQDEVRELRAALEDLRREAAEVLQKTDPWAEAGARRLAERLAEVFAGLPPRSGDDK